MNKRVVLAAVLVLLAVLSQRTAAQSADVQVIVVTNDLTLQPGAALRARLLVRASGVTIDAQGATLVGPGQLGDLKSLENAGAGVLIEGANAVTLRNLKARGFATGLVVRQARGLLVEGCDFSDNYHNPGHGWGELPPRGGVLCQDVTHAVFRGNRANRVWDGLHFIESDDNLVESNDFSHCSNTAAKLWKSCRNRFLGNNLSYGIRIDRAKGEVHARDSTCVLIETGSDDNYWYRNDITQGGDGIFIRPLNRWVSRGNIFVENDTSHANNNCVESWSPGNVFIRNKANHGSYGFWLGGSDHTVLIGNEAAFNGLTNGNHNAPEPGFGHGGIVIVGGSSSHTIIEGNNLHDNHGAGIALRGDVGSQGVKWRAEHWIIQNNRIAGNRIGLWARWADAILLAQNTFINNGRDRVIQDVADMVDLPWNTGPCLAPRASLLGPALVQVGEKVRFDAQASRDPLGRPLQFLWWLDGKVGGESSLERIFDQPGFYRLGLTVHNGSLADLAWRDVLAVRPVSRELGTEGDAARWGFELELNQNGQGRLTFEDDPDAVIGRRCLRFSPNPYPGAYATVIYPAARNAGWNFAGKTRLSFWIKARNPNLPGYQNAGPVLRLLGPSGEIELKPAKDANLLNNPPFSEARWTWMAINIPLEGDSQWTRKITGQAGLDRVDALSLSLDSWGGDPFEVWLDGLTVE